MTSGASGTSARFTPPVHDAASRAASVTSARDPQRRELPEWVRHATDGMFGPLRPEAERKAAAVVDLWHKFYDIGDVNNVKDVLLRMAQSGQLDGLGSVHRLRQWMERNRRQATESLEAFVTRITVAVAVVSP